MANGISIDFHISVFVSVCNSFSGYLFLCATVFVYLFLCASVFVDLFDEPHWVGGGLS